MIRCRKELRNDAVDSAHQLESFLRLEGLMRVEVCLVLDVDVSGSMINEYAAPAIHFLERCATPRLEEATLV